MPVKRDFENAPTSEERMKRMKNLNRLSGRVSPFAAYTLPHSCVDILINQFMLFLLNDFFAIEEERTEASMALGMPYT